LETIDVRLEIIQPHVEKPKRATTYSAGYDVYAPSTICIPPFESYELELPFLFTYNYLILNKATFLFTPRSSYGIKKKMRLINSKKEFIAKAIYNDITNQLIVHLYNDSPTELLIPKGEHFLQFVITKEKDVFISVEFECVSPSIKEKHPPYPSFIRQKENKYDWIINKDFHINPNEQLLLSTGYKASFNQGAWLTASLHPSVNSKLMFANSTPVIDADYYNNKNNEGLIFIAVVNVSEQPIMIPKGTALCSFFAQPFYLLSDDEGNNVTRTGGIGHTTK